MDATAHSDEKWYFVHEEDVHSQGDISVNGEDLVRYGRDPSGYRNPWAMDGLPFERPEIRSKNVLGSLDVIIHCDRTVLQMVNNDAFVGTCRWTHNNIL